MIDAARHIHAIAAQLLPRGYDVAARAPSTYADLLAHWRMTGRILVWDGASAETAFQDARINHAFRAWHDMRHVTGRHAFDRRGEYGAHADMVADVRRYIGDAAQTIALLGAEICGQFDYAQLHGGEFPRDQRAFDLAYLRNPQSALHARY